MYTGQQKLFTQNTKPNPSYYIWSCMHVHTCTNFYGTTDKNKFSKHATGNCL